MNFVELKSDEQAQLIIVLRQQHKEMGLPPVVKNCLPWLTFNCNELPEVLLLVAGTFLDNESGINSLTDTSRGMRFLFQPMKIVNKFLERVAYGEQDKNDTIFNR